MERSRRLHDAFYAMLDGFLDDLAQRGPFVVLDIHSYNHRRAGADRPPAPGRRTRRSTSGRVPWTATGGVTSWTASWATSRSRGWRAIALDVRENVRFKGGYLCQRVHERYPETRLRARRRAEEGLHGRVDRQARRSPPRRADRRVRGRRCPSCSASSRAGRRDLHRRSPPTTSRSTASWPTWPAASGSCSTSRRSTSPRCAAGSSRTGGLPRSATASSRTTPTVAAKRLAEVPVQDVVRSDAREPPPRQAARAAAAARDARQPWLRTAPRPQHRAVRRGDRRAPRRRSGRSCARSSPRARRRVRGSTPRRSCKAAQAELDRYRAFAPDLESHVEVREGSTGVMVSNGDVLIAPTVPGGRRADRGAAPPRGRDPRGDPRQRRPPAAPRAGQRPGRPRRDPGGPGGARRAPRGRAHAGRGCASWPLGSWRST